MNRFASNADATVTAVTYARDQTHRAMAEITSAATAAWEGLVGIAGSSQRESRGTGGGASGGASARAPSAGAAHAGSPGHGGSTASDSTAPDAART